MKIELNCYGVLDLDRISDCDPELDGIITLLSMVCSQLEESGKATFIVSGFGENNWPVDISTDLAVFLEQLPQSILSFDKNVSFEIDFYEQGVERTLLFCPEKNNWSIRCVSRTAWMPDPMTFSINSDTLRVMLSNAMNAFLQYIEPLRRETSSWYTVIDDWQHGCC